MSTTNVCCDYILPKIILLGESGVGKTSTALRFVKGEYYDKQASTVIASYFVKSV